jgi:hypothetical protein
MARVKDAAIDLHNKYDGMSVHELVAALVYAPDNLNVHIDAMHDYSQDHDIIESALRKAVIREESVGEVYVARDYTDGCPEFRFKCPESLTGEVKGQHICKLCGELMPERQYLLIPGNLIPKETP